MRRRTLHRALTLVALALGVGPAGSALAANSTMAGPITAYATIECAGIEWRITGDDNANCAVAVEYRKQPGLLWKSAQPLLRVETGLWHHGEDPGNLLAGSLFSLEPASTYDVRLTLSDPDGGASQQVVTVTTRAEPKPDPLGRVRFVTPGTGGGTGTALDPFRGLAAADAAAQPGDVFIVQPGTYATRFVPTKNGTLTQPIVYAGTDPGRTLIDGGGGTSSTSNCVDLSNRQYVLVENLGLVNCLRPVVASNSVGVEIRGCTIQPIHQLLSTIGIYADAARDLYVADNTILMPGDWAGIGRTGTYGTGGYGVLVTGNGIVICYNKVVEAWDALDAGGSDGTGARTFNVDIHHNVVDRASDDACQTDAIHQNVRVFRNRFLNSGSAVSCQPCFGGPCYFLFNEMFNTRIDPFKYHQETFYFGATDPQETSGMIAFHNTNIGSRSGWYESGIWHHAKHRNNLLLGALPNAYTFYTTGAQRGDLDYDGYNRQQSNLVKYNNVAYATLPAFFTGAGQEQHGIEVTTRDFVSAPYPAHPDWTWSIGYGAAYSTADFDLRLAPGSLAVDRGQVLANIDDDYAGAAPDLGCYETGRPMTAYGPRSLAIVDVPERPAASVSGLRLLAPRPNPTGGAAEFTLESGRDASVAISIVDVEGRRVRALEQDRALPVGAHAFRWDGRDDSGAPVRSGLYYVIVRSAGATLTSRIVMLR